jgi:hypothetical protein
MYPVLIQSFSCSKSHHIELLPFGSDLSFAHTGELVCALEENEQCPKEVARGG